MQLQTPNCLSGTRTRAFFPLAALMDFKEFGADDPMEGETEGLDSLKALTEKLKLQTRRPSYLEWQERLQSKQWKEICSASSPGSAGEETAMPANSGEDNSEVAVRNICGFDTIDDALEFLRKELVSDCKLD